MGRSVAFTILGLALGFCLTTNGLGQYDYSGGGSTDVGADRKGPLKGVAAPMVTGSTGYAILGANGAFHSFNEAQGIRVTYRGAGFDVFVEKGNAVSYTHLTLPTSDLV